LILRGRITRRLVLAFAALALLALVLSLGSIALVRVSHDTLTRVAARAEIAALSARIRSESLTLTDIVRNYTHQPADPAAQRALFDSQTQLLDTLIEQAIAATDPNDVEESIRISQVCQNLIAFTAQAGRVLTAYDTEGVDGPQTNRLLTILVENYQQPLIHALRDFEQLELDQVNVAQAQADRTIALATGVLVATAVVVVIAVLVMISLVLTRIAVPLAKLRAGVEDIRQGQLDRSVVIDTRDEFGELAGALNMMTAEVRQARRQQEEYAHTLEQQVTDRTREVERRANQVATGAAIGRAITSLLNVDELIVRIVDLIRERYGFYYVALFLIDAEGRQAVLQYGTGEPGRVLMARDHQLLIGGQSIVGWVCVAQVARVARDVAADAMHWPNPLLPETRAELALPLQLGERFLGVLDLQSAKLADFDSDEVTALQALADQVAIALENARLYSELHTNYERLQALERLRDDLTYMIVHDLRTPLTSFITGLPMIGEVGDLNDLQRQLLRRVVHGGDTLLSMINNLLDVARMESGSLQLHYADVAAAEITAWAVDQVTMLAADRRLKLVQQVAADVPVFQADVDLLRRVLVNLLGNAIKFSPTAGVVTITAQRAAETDSIQFSVADAGPGIQPENFERIFEKFGQVQTARSSRKGSAGLGLTFCKLAVEAHGGRIWVESEAGHGSTFAFVLPLTR
jgi:signal transduction histidine kinase/HAMP domain-containing protein